MQVRNLFLLIVSLLLLPACSNPYFSMSGGSQLLIEKDISFLEIYKKSLCNIKEMHESEEISRGKCLAMYFDSTENDRAKKEVLTRVGYISNNPGKFDKDFSDRLFNITTQTTDCTNYIKQNCM